GIHRPDGIVGDLGGGSLELVDVRGMSVKSGVTLPLGSLALQDVSAKSIKKAERFVRQALSDVPKLAAGAGRTFYAVGGTWRSLARLHMWQTGYPLHVMHGYVIPAKEALEFSRLVHRVNPEMLSRIEVVSDARRRLARASGLSRRAVREHHRECLVRRHRSSRPRLSGARRVLPPRRTDRRRVVAAAARARLGTHTGSLTGAWRRAEGRVPRLRR